MGNTIFGANTADPAYEISNSLRLNDGDTTYLKKTVGDGNRRKWTLSMWLKKSTIINNTEMYLWASDATGAGGIHDGAGFYSFGSVTGDNTSNSFHHQLGDAHGRIIASAHARDVSAWYHMVWNVDTANGTAADRMKLFVNGSRITDQVVSQTNPDQNFDTEWNRNSTENYLFADHNYTRYYFDGYVADVAFVDGQAYDASYFGKTNNQGIWVPIEPDVSSWGTNGFFLEFKQTGTSANSSGIGADTSGNDNHFAVTNLAATDVTEDTCTNNFATMNPLAVNASGTATFSEGNCQVATVVSGSMGGYCNIHFPSSGKWYCEAKITTSSPSNAYIGVVGYDASDSNTFTNGDSTFYYGNGQKYVNNSTSSYGTAWSQNDIIGMAVNVDDNEITFYLNGSSQGTLSETLEDKTWNCGDTNGSISHTFQWNFGNPVHTISSGNTDGKYGNFEYAPPSGYYALCTKRLAAFG